MPELGHFPMLEDPKRLLAYLRPELAHILSVRSPHSLLPTYEVYALRYATVDRKRRENFIATPDPHEGAMPMDYYVWLIRNGERVVLVDTGFNADAAEGEGRTFLRCPVDALTVLGIAPSTVRDVIITHLHYDHAGNVLLPKARLHLQGASCTMPAVAICVRCAASCVRRGRCRRCRPRGV